MSNTTSERFNLDDLLSARALTVEVVHSVAAQVQAGMKTEEVEAILTRELAERGITKLWHPSKVRLGANTTKSFRELNDDVILEEGDPFFLDIGPVYQDHEGDYGETFICGQDISGHSRLAHGVKQIFDVTKAAWQDDHLSGEALYQVAMNEATKLDLVLNPAMGGHRVGEFPHALHYKGQLLPYDSIPHSGLWILEILVVDPAKGRGAFYEDLLIE